MNNSRRINSSVYSHRRRADRPWSLCPNCMSKVFSSSCISSPRSIAQTRTYLLRSQSQIKPLRNAIQIRNQPLALMLIGRLASIQIATIHAAARSNANTLPVVQLSR